MTEDIPTYAVPVRHPFVGGVAARNELADASFLPYDDPRTRTCWRCRLMLRSGSVRASGAHVMVVHVRDEHVVAPMIICPECWPAMPENVRGWFAKQAVQETFLVGGARDLMGLGSVPTWGALP